MRTVKNDSSGGKAGFYILVPVGRPVEVVQYMGPKITLDLLKANVGTSGLVDVVQLHRGRSGRSIDLWIDDEGLLRNPPLWNRLVNGQPLAGSMLICASDADGDSVPLTLKEAQHWFAVAASWPGLRLRP